MRVYALLVGVLLACETGAPAAREPSSADTVVVATVEPPEASDPIANEPVSDSPPASGADAPQVMAVESWLERYDFDERLWHVDLPGRLDEVSGLAFDDAGRLFAHDDEIGRVHELHPTTGEVIGRVQLGGTALRDDFEGLAIAGERHFLISSAGLLYEFRAEPNNATVDFRATDTGVGAGCEVEGLDVLDGEALLLACKAVSPERGFVVLLRLPLTGDAPTTLIEVDRDELRGTEVDRDFAPSAVAVTPTGTLALLSGRHESIIEVDREGHVLFTAELRSGRHPQSEGIAFGPDSTLYIADEKNGQDARLTAYRPVDGKGGE